MAKRTAQPSWLHRITGVTPGSVPHAVLASNECSGMDLMLAIELAGLFLAIRVWQTSAIFALVAIGVVAGFVFLVEQPFRKSERLGRARMRTEQ